ncbi:GNAT superfamily N-acetyltransferase [Catalinimonas alkaloidigena]|uniref:GNAT family N-acetyltransferase n=1 Tax=Catalinimonas alkaloidigena TaxID=1075417 RepID=UPI00240688A6|nr:GNAT family N-acetyltransferase [Catalinimonas alkaloidigena]MDF9797752.1 GNAT superfamily N-acetyltransferase [Catalinimonas alkaloidigena]
MAGVRIKKFTGSEILQYLDDLAALRIEVFRSFPYLYDGNEAYEKDYLSTYTRAEGSAVILALEHEEVVGASTCIPLVEETEAIKKAFEGTEYPVEDVMYFGESVLKESYRGRGIGVEFFRQREGHAHNLKKKYASFCAVERRADHPLKPENYKPLHGFWEKRGYTRLPQLETTMRWKDIDQQQETDKTFKFWIKELR